MKPSLAQQLQVLVNPSFDHAVEPEDQETSYVSPVRLANELVRISNVMVDVSKGIAILTERRNTLKSQKRILEDARASLERDLLRDVALTPSEAKSLKTIEAAVASRALIAGVEDQFATWDEAISGLSGELDEVQAKLDVYRTYLEVGERVTDNLRSVLSFQKQEWKAAHG